MDANEINDGDAAERNTGGRFTPHGASTHGRNGGRPTAYSEEVAEEICDRLMEGQSLNTICADERLPCRVTVWRWMEEDRRGFCNRYARARVIQATTLSDEAMDMLRACPDSVAAAAKCRELAKHIQWLAERFDRPTFGPQHRIDIQAEVRQLSDEERAVKFAEGLIRDGGDLLGRAVAARPDLAAMLRGLLASAPPLALNSPEAMHGGRT